MQNQIYEIEKLQILLEQIRDKYADRERFIHPRTVGNFLSHFHSFKDRKRKDHIYKNLTDFLDVLSNLETEDLDANSSARLFDQFIVPIVNYYDVYRGFSVYIKWSYFLFVVIILIGILTLVDFAVYYKIALALIAFVVFLRNRYKVKLRKTYGIFH